MMMPTVLDLTPHFRLIPPHSRPQPPGWALKRGFKNGRVSQAATSLSRPATKRTTTSTPRQNATVLDIDNYDPIKSSLAFFEATAMGTQSGMCMADDDAGRLGWYQRAERLDHTLDRTRPRLPSPHLTPSLLSFAVPLATAATLPAALEITTGE